MSAWDDLDQFMTPEIQAKVDQFMAEAANEDDDFDINEVLVQNHADAMQAWFGKNGFPAREDLQ